MTPPLLCVVGARPNYMKMAPLLRAFAALAQPLPAVLVHTGQHYDPMLKDRLFADLGLRDPDENLDVRSGSHAVQTAEVMKRFEPLLDRHRPRAVVVVGDVNSTLACSLVAAKASVPVVHVEAGLRSFDRSMPEEINRVLTDQIADLLYTTEPEALANLAREGIAAERAVFVGNLMIDSLLDALPRATPVATTLRNAGVDPDLTQGAGFALVTLHRPSNVDDPTVLAELVDLLRRLAEDLPLVWPLHPRTRANLERHALAGRLQHPRIALLPPQGYLEMVGLLRDCRIAITDSGGVQEETTALGKPCLTLRENTERPVTLTEGTNRLVGRDPGLFRQALDAALQPERQRVPRRPAGWDGRSAPRLAAHLNEWLDRRA